MYIETFTLRTSSFVLAFHKKKVSFLDGSVRSMMARNLLIFIIIRCSVECNLLINLVYNKESCILLKLGLVLFIVIYVATRTDNWEILAL